VYLSKSFPRIANLFLRKLLKIFHKLNIGITTASNLTKLQDIALDSSRSDLEFIKAMGKKNFEPLLMLLSESKSQLRQDLLVLAHTNYKLGGFFVEFGASNGVLLSNSFLLEYKYAWTGILAEPGQIWKADLQINRPNAKNCTKCVWSNSNQILTFEETQDPEKSTISFFGKGIKGHSRNRIINKYQVETISLVDLLFENNAPRHIDYLSIDTEGSEFKILQSFDFSKYSFKVITVEHNFSKNRELIFNLLTNHGYKRMFENLSKWDDWYFK
jgi:FkbM family methyltransferase